MGTSGKQSLKRSMEEEEEEVVVVGVVATAQEVLAPA
jgi:hypothetical protein